MKTIYTLLLLCSCAALSAQDPFKLAVGSKAIEFREIDHLTVVGGSGSELVVEGRSAREQTDPRADGLRKISASGLRDNTGFGLSVTESEGRILVQQVGGEGKAVTVRVPNSASVRVEQSTYRGGDLEVRDFSGALDVSMMYHEVELSNVTGPQAVNAVYGDITAVWNAPPTEEARLHSTYSSVDVTLPAVAKVDVRLSTGYGEMFTDFDMQMKANTAPEVKAEPRPRVRVYSSDDGGSYTYDYRGGGERKSGLTGTINGGGPLLALTATYKNIYLRKK